MYGFPLPKTGLGDRSLKTWFAFAPDIVIEGNPAGNTPHQGSPEQPQPVPEPTPPPVVVTPPAPPRPAPPRPAPPARMPTGPFRLPGFSSTFYLSEPIIPNGNFTWAEATRNGSRIPVSRNVTYGIIRLARVMEEVRARLGDRPIRVNSWYPRPCDQPRSRWCPLFSSSLRRCYRFCRYWHPCLYRL